MNFEKYMGPIVTNILYENLPMTFDEILEAAAAHFDVSEEIVEPSVRKAVKVGVFWNFIEKVNGNRYTIPSNHHKSHQFLAAAIALFIVENSDETGSEDDSEDDFEDDWTL
ncbi:hypothetical protein KR026_009513 [Drosophila bipectinata]|nr:hypothetical protein KR026_009513 [Drosophila bipectinata]